MFDIEVMDAFHWEITEGDVIDEVKEAYYLFIDEFCKCISYQWKVYLEKECKDPDKATFKSNLTASDEALTWWLVKCKYADAKKDAERIQEVGKEIWKEENKKKRKEGKHDSKEKLPMYIDRYTAVTKCRTNDIAYKFWQDMFFNKFFASEQRSVSRKKRNITDDIEKDAQLPYDATFD
jgi:hypothetical protein